MKKNKFWLGYGIFVVVLLSLCIFAVGSVKQVLLEYEEAQPEKIAEEQIEIIRDAAATDRLAEVITFYEVEQAEYDKDISDFREYKNKIKNAKELTYKIKNGYSETEQQFYILADDEVVAVLTLESIKEEVKLAILTLNEWTVKSITPVLTLSNYDYTVEVPEGFTVTINGTILTDGQAAARDGWELYEPETLYCEPDIKIYDEYGDEAVFDIVNNHVTPVVHTYTMHLPADFQVFAGGNLQKGVADGENVLYSLVTIHEALELKDIHGNSVEYRANNSIYSYDYVIRIPDNFRITINGEDGSKYITGTAPNKEYISCAEFVKMPEVVTYEMNRALCEPSVEIYDNLGKAVECEFVNGTFEMLKQSGEDTLPEELASEVDVLELAKMWSKFMTDDLEGSLNGFETLKKYLVKNSYRYNVAYKWATDIDITFIFSHVYENPPFTDERVSNYIRYSEDLFSCDIYFKKHMQDTVGRNGDKKIVDIMNSTFYFMYHDGTNDGKDNPCWVILEIHEILAE